MPGGATMPASECRGLWHVRQESQLKIKWNVMHWEGQTCPQCKLGAPALAPGVPANMNVSQLE
eukprot:908254-Amphidinium_carterae.1